MRILFMGTPEFAAVSLEALLAAQMEVIGVVTQPDRVNGRGGEIHPSPVKQLALQRQLPIWQPEKVNTPGFIEKFQRLNPSLVVVVAFGQKIPAPILFEPEYRCINVHGSLLPCYRGAAPIQWSVLNGDSRTGVTTMYMDEGWDTGDIIFQDSIEIDPDENFGTLYRRLSQTGGELLVRTVQALQAGTAPRLTQNDVLASMAPKLSPDLQQIHWGDPAARIHNIVRVFAPAPGAETYCNGERLKILATQRGEYLPTKDTLPGCILQIVKKRGILVATQDQPLLITLVHPAGKKPMAATDYANGRHLKVGMMLDEKGKK